MFGEGFHADLTFYQSEPKLTAVRGIKLHKGVTKTGFKDMRKLYNTLPTDLKYRLERVSANHTNKVDRYGIHPVFKNGNAIYVNWAFTRHLIDHDDHDLQLLFRHIEQDPGFNVTWSQNDILIWDNHKVQHCAWNDHAEREIERVIVL